MIVIILFSHSIDFALQRLERLHRFIGKGLIAPAILMTLGGLSAMSLGIGYWECLYLAEFLGLEKFFNLLVVAHHFAVVQGRRNLMDPTWLCDRVPVAGKIPSEPCAKTKSVQSITCVGATLAS